jgi:L-aminopeptidase/D-esterase-like protein
MALLVKSSMVRPPMAQISGMERPLKRATKIAAITVSTSSANGVSAATSRMLAKRIFWTIVFAPKRRIPW